MGDSLDARALGQPGGFFDSLTNALAHSVDGYATAQDKRGDRDYRLALRTMDEKSRKYRDALTLAEHGVDPGVPADGSMDPEQASSVGMLARRVQGKERLAQTNWEATQTAAAAEREAARKQHIEDRATDDAWRTQSDASANERAGIAEDASIRRDAQLLEVTKNNAARWRDTMAMRGNDAAARLNWQQRAQALKQANDAAMRGALIPGKNLTDKPTFDQGRYHELMKQARVDIDAKFSSPGQDLGRMLSVPDGDGMDGEGAGDAEPGATVPPVTPMPTHTSAYPDGEFNWYNPNDLLRAVRNAPDTYTVPGADLNAPKPVAQPLGPDVSPDDMRSWISMLGNTQDPGRSAAVAKLKAWGQGIGEDGKPNPALIQRHAKIRSAIEAANKSTGK